MSTLASLNVILTASTLGFTKGLATAEGGLTHFVHKAEGLLSRFGAFNPQEIFHHALDAFSEQEQALTKMEGILTATGGAAGLTSRQMQELAVHLEETTRFSQTATIGAEALLASFGKIKGEVFERAVHAAQDLSSALGKDLSSAAMLVGRALQDPERGLKKLAKTGVTFTADQRQLIARLTETGHVAEAQVVILSALEGKFAGLSEAMANTTGGKIDQFHNALHHLYVLIGESLGPAMKYFVDMVKSGVHWVSEHSSALYAVARAALFSVAAIEGARLAIKALGAAEKVTATITAFLKALSGPEGWVELAIGVTAATLAVSLMNSALEKVEGSAKKAAGATSGIKLPAGTGGNELPTGESEGFLKALAEQQRTLSGMAAKMWEEALDPAFKYYIQVNRINAVYSAGLINVEVYRRALARAYDEYDVLGKKVRDFQADLEKQIATMGMSANMAALWQLRQDGFKGADSIRTEALIRQLDAMEKQKDVAEELNRLADEANRLALGDEEFQLAKLAEMGATADQLEQARYLMDEIARMKEKDREPNQLPGAPAAVVRRFTEGTPGQRAFDNDLKKNTGISAAEAPKQTGKLGDIADALGAFVRDFEFPVVDFL